MRLRASLGAWVLGLVLGASSCMAGYLEVSMSTPRQCETSTIQWSGDDGPFHLLLTPTAHVQHGYNVWLPSIPANAKNYSLTIRQPAGLQFVLTMWGASGISYAGTTDVLTVGQPVTANASCYLKDDEILGLYSFSFDIASTNNGYPPQCSNLTMSWPTSLESNVTGTITKRDTIADSVDAIDGVLDAALPETVFDERDVSSSEHVGNTSYPPSMFGVIPLGNSFDIPITYNRNSKYAKYLPNSSRSDTPTTWTSNGVTSLNWTVQLAKGTRFILVAGIGSDQQWASGGSSALLTVGQGTTDCTGASSGTTDDSPVPSITATGTSDPGPTGGSNGSSPSGTSPIVRTVLACVLSVLGTLLVVGLCGFCYRRRKRRRAAKEQQTVYPSGSLRKLDRTSGVNGVDVNDTPLDLVGSRDGPRVTPILTMGAGAGGSGGGIRGGVESPRELTPTSTDPFTNPLHHHHHAPRYGTDTRQSSGTFSSDPALDGVSRIDFNRQSSLDPLLAGTYDSRQSSLPPNDSYSGGMNTLSTHRPLTLHDQNSGLPFDEEGEQRGLNADGGPDLKRDTLAYLGEGSQQPGSGNGGGNGATGPARRAVRGQRRRRDIGEGPEYLIHQDAGRILELPPRYEDMNWERENATYTSGTGTGTGGDLEGGNQRAGEPEPRLVPGEPVRPVIDTNVRGGAGKESG